MSTPPSVQSSSRRVPAASTRFILTGLAAASASLALGASAAAQTNGVSAFLHVVDGQFTNGVGVGEWSDVTPAAFISSLGGTAVPTTLTDPLANSLLFAGLGRTSPVSDIALFLMYDFLPRTPGTPIQFGEIFASITFPITLPGPQGVEQNVSVLFQGAFQPAASGGGGGSGSFFDIFVDLDLNGTGDVPAVELGIRGAAGFGPSPLSTLPHLLVELEVPLRIPAGFADPGGPLPGNGINPATGLYDPDPAFWGAAAGGDERPLGAEGEVAGSPPLQPASAANLTINPDGSTTVVPVPEPSSAALALAGMAVLGMRRRKS